MITPEMVEWLELSLRVTGLESVNIDWKIYMQISSFQPVDLSVLVPYFHDQLAYVYLIIFKTHF